MPVRNDLRGDRQGRVLRGAGSEVELGVVIGAKVRYLDSPEKALAHVAGYTVSHDVS